MNGNCLDRQYFQNNMNLKVYTSQKYLKCLPQKIIYNNIFEKCSFKHSKLQQIIIQNLAI